MTDWLMICTRRECRFVLLVVVPIVLFDLVFFELVLFGRAALIDCCAWLTCVSHGLSQQRWRS